MILFLISLSLVTVAKGVSNGTFANVGLFPFAVALYQDKNTVTCSGALVSYQHILTAASCVMGSKKVKYAMAGDVQGREFEDHPSTRTFIKVKNRIPHPEALNKYKKINHEYDIAVLKTKKPFPKNENIQTIKIVQQDMYVKTPALILGFGSNLSLTSLFHKGLSYLNVETQACPPESFNLDGTLICASSPKGGSGRLDDKGGPLISKNAPFELYGCFSELAGRVNLVANAMHVKSWIQEQLK